MPVHMATSPMNAAYAAGDGCSMCRWFFHATCGATDDAVHWQLSNATHGSLLHRAHVQSAQRDQVKRSICRHARCDYCRAIRLAIVRLLLSNFTDSYLQQVGGDALRQRHQRQAPDLL